MSWLINYIRSCFCRHDWQMIKDIHYHLSPELNVPCGGKRVYVCRKCMRQKDIEW